MCSPQWRRNTSPEMKQIGDILTRHKTPVAIQDDVTYKQVTIRTNYKGVVLRGTKIGSEIGHEEPVACLGWPVHSQPH